MAKATLNCLFFLLLSSSTLCFSETLVAFYYDARRETSASSIANTNLLMQNKVPPTQKRVLVSDYGLLDSLSKTGHPVDIYLSYAQIEHLWNLKPTDVGRLKPHFKSGKIKSITVVTSFSSQLSVRDELRLLLSSLRSTHTLLSQLRVQNQVKVSAMFRLSQLESLSRQQMGEDLDRVFEFLQKAKSFVTLEADMNGQLGSRESIVNKERAGFLRLWGSTVPILLVVKGSGGVPCGAETACFNRKIVKSLGSNHVVPVKIIGLLADIAPAGNSYLKDTMSKDLVSSTGHRQLLADLNTRITSHDTFNPPTTSFPTVPITDPSTAQPNFPSYTPTPTIVTVPGAATATDTPTNPAALPVTAPPDPMGSPVPVSNPTTPDTIPVAQPITNPATYYPPPTGDNPVTEPVTPPEGDTPVTDPVTPPVGDAGNNPVTNPVTPSGGGNPATNPVTPPVGDAGDSPVTNPVTPSGGGNPATNPVTTPATNAPTGSGQTWCVAKSGVSESALQAALDYACGIGGADCSMIQQGASCYDPASLERHASYAFNSYYQKNPTPDSCDFGGAAVLVNNNPSTGSCIYPSSATVSPSSTVPPATTSSTVPPASTSSTVPPASTASPLSTVPPATTASPSGSTGYGSNTPSAPNTSYPGSADSPLVFGSQGAPDFNTTTSGSTSLQHVMSCLLLMTLFVIGRLVLAP